MTADDVHAKLHRAIELMSDSAHTGGVPDRKAATREAAELARTLSLAAIAFELHELHALLADDIAVKHGRRVEPILHAERPKDGWGLGILQQVFRP